MPGIQYFKGKKVKPFLNLRQNLNATDCQPLTWILSLLPRTGCTAEEMPTGAGHCPCCGGGRRVPTLGGEQDPLGVVGEAQPGGRLGVGEQLHPLHELLPPGKAAPSLPPSARRRKCLLPARRVPGEGTHLMPSGIWMSLCPSTLQASLNSLSKLLVVKSRSRNVLSRRWSNSLSTRPP